MSGTPLFSGNATCELRCVTEADDPNWTPGVGEYVSNGQWEEVRIIAKGDFAEGDTLTYEILWKTMYTDDDCEPYEEWLAFDKCEFKLDCTHQALIVDAHDFTIRVCELNIASGGEVKFCVTTGKRYRT